MIPNKESQIKTKTNFNESYIYMLCFSLFLDMKMYDNKFKTKENQWLSINERCGKILGAGFPNCIVD